ncbi:unnamed protein product [Gordionus sp. m RMFG-2023]
MTINFFLFFSSTLGIGIVKRLPIKSEDEEFVPNNAINDVLPPPKMIYAKDDYAKGCKLASNFYDVGTSWNPDLGPPFGVLYCYRCTCIKNPVFEKRSILPTVIKCHNFKDTCAKVYCRAPVKLPGKCCKICPSQYFFYHGSPVDNRLNTSFFFPAKYYSLKDHWSRKDSSFFPSLKSLLNSDANFKPSYSVSKSSEQIHSITNGKTFDKTDSKINTMEESNRFQSDQASNYGKNDNDITELYSLLIPDNLNKYYGQIAVEGQYLNPVSARVYAYIERQILYLTIKTVGLENPSNISFYDTLTNTLLYEMPVQRLYKNFDGEYIYIKICFSVYNFEEFIASRNDMINGKIKISLSHIPFASYANQNANLSISSTIISTLSGVIQDHRFIQTESFSSILTPTNSDNRMYDSSNGDYKSRAGLVIFTKGYYDHDTLDFLFILKDNQRPIIVNVYDERDFREITIRFVWHKNFGSGIPMIPFKHITGYINMKSGEFASSWPSIPRTTMGLILSGNVKIVVEIKGPFGPFQLNGIIFVKTTCSALYASLTGYDAYPMTHTGMAGYILMKLNENGKLDYKIQVSNGNNKEAIIKTVSIMPYNHRRKNLARSNYKYPNNAKAKTLRSGSKKNKRIIAEMEYNHADPENNKGSFYISSMTVMHLLIHKDFYARADDSNGNNLLSGPIKIIHFPSDPFQTFPIVLSSNNVNSLAAYTLPSSVGGILWMQKQNFMPPKHINTLDTDDSHHCEVLYRLSLIGLNTPEIDSKSADYFNNYEISKGKDMLTIIFKRESFSDMSTQNLLMNGVQNPSKITDSIMHIQNYHKSLALGKLTLDQNWCHDFSSGNIFVYVLTKQYLNGEIGSQIVIKDVAEDEKLPKISSQKIINYNKYEYSKSTLYTKPANIDADVFEMREDHSPMNCSKDIGNHVTNRWKYFVSNCRKCQCRKNLLFCKATEDECQGSDASSLQNKKNLRIYAQKCCDVKNNYTQIPFIPVSKLDVKKSNSCIFGSDIYPKYANWNPKVPPFGVDKCVTCHCGPTLKVVCERVKCPIMSCPLNNVVYTEGSCCKVCKSDLNSISDYRNGDEVDKRNLVAMDAYKGYSKRSKEPQRDGPYSNYIESMCKFREKEYYEGELYYAEISAFQNMPCIVCICKSSKWVCNRCTKKQNRIRNSTQIYSNGFDHSIMPNKHLNYSIPVTDQDPKYKLKGKTSIKQNDNIRVSKIEQINKSNKSNILQNTTLSLASGSIIKDWMREKKGRLKTRPGKKGKIKNGKKRCGKRKNGKKRKRGKFCKKNRKKKGKKHRKKVMDIKNELPVIVKNYLKFSNFTSEM